MKVIVGLGNPGKEYENTRHNIGFMILDNYLGNIKWSKDQKSLTFKTKKFSEDVIFVKPQTFMNLSGEAVQYFMNYYKVNYSDLLVIHDDMDLPLGNLRIKYSSGAGGHNGIKNIIELLNSDAFFQLKFGIDHPNDHEIINYVLHKFSSDEIKILNAKFDICNNIIDDFINGDKRQELMNKYN